VRPPMPTSAHPSFCPGTSGRRISGTCAAAGDSAPASGAATSEPPAAWRKRRRESVGSMGFMVRHPSVIHPPWRNHWGVWRNSPQRPGARGLLPELGARVRFFDDEGDGQDVADLGGGVDLDAEPLGPGVLAEGEVLALAGRG